MTDKDKTQLGKSRPKCEFDSKKLTKKKARKILRHGRVRGKKLTKAQRGFFGAKSR